MNTSARWISVFVAAMLLPGLAVAAMAAEPLAIPPVGPHGIPPAARTVSSRAVPAIAKRWAAAWNSCDQSAMVALFTRDGIYDDNAFQARSEGSAGIGAWVALTCNHLSNAHAEILDSFQTGDRVAIRWVFSGSPSKDSPMGSAAGKTFSVPVMTVLELDGGRIRYDADYYNLADLFRQLGIPAGPWVPPAP